MHHLWRVETLYWMDIALPGADLSLSNFNPNHHNLSSSFCTIRVISWTLKANSLNDAKFVTTGDTGGCHNNNPQCCQYSKVIIMAAFIFQYMLIPDAIDPFFSKASAIWHVVKESSSCNEPNLPLRHQGSPKRPTYLIVLVLTSLLWRWVMKCYWKCTVFGGNTVVLKWIACIAYKEKIPFLYTEIVQVIEILLCKRCISYKVITMASYW